MNTRIITTCTGLKIPENFFMKKTFWHKGYVWITSVVDGRALMSIHKTGHEQNAGGSYYVGIYRHDHEKQLQDLYNEVLRREKEEEQVITIDDRTDESRQIINQTSRILPGDLND